MKFPATTLNKKPLLVLPCLFIGGLGVIGLGFDLFTLGETHFVSFSFWGCINLVVTFLIFREAWKYSVFIYKSYVLGFLLVVSVLELVPLALGPVTTNGTSIMFDGSWIICAWLFYFGPSQEESTA